MNVCKSTVTLILQECNSPDSLWELHEYDTTTSFLSFSHVYKHTHAGRFVTKFRTKGLMTGGNYLADPMGIVVTDDGTVLVTDSEKACVQMFDDSGKYLGKFGQDDAGRLRHPSGNHIRF